MTEKDKPFCVIKFKQLPPGVSDDLQCLPKSWIRCVHDGNQVTVAYPPEMNAQIMNHLRKGKPPLRKWPLYSAVVQWHVGSYSEWQQVSSVFTRHHFLETMTPRNFEKPNIQQTPRKDYKEGILSQSMTTSDDVVENVNVSTPKADEANNLGDGNVDWLNLCLNINEPSARKRPIQDTPKRVDFDLSNKQYKRFSTNEPTYLVSDNDDSRLDNSIDRCGIQINEGASTSQIKTANTVTNNGNNSAITGVQKSSLNPQLNELFVRQLTDACEQVILMLKVILEGIGKPTSDK